MINPFDEHDVTELSAEAFELAVKQILEASGSDLKAFVAEHRRNVHGVDGAYEVDVRAAFTALNVDFQVLVECKHHKHPIRREVVQVLHDKIRSTGSHKGMIFATSTFQKGALEYAKAHGIALIRIADGKTCYETRCLYPPPEPPPWLNLPDYVGWWMALTEEGAIQMSLIWSDGAEGLMEFLNINQERTIG